MTVDEFHFLSQLYLHAPCCVKTLCEQTGIHPPRASRLLNTLERKKYVVRALGIDDRRKELLTLTELGHGVALEILRSCASSEYFLSELTAAAPGNGTAPH
jgi:DNA-binding MarR family transcriptional regulator